MYPERRCIRWYYSEKRKKILIGVTTHLVQTTLLQKITLFWGEFKIPSVCISRGSGFHCYIIGTLVTGGGNRNLVKCTRMEFLIPPKKERFFVTMQSAPNAS